MRGHYKVQNKAKQVHRRAHFGEGFYNLRIDVLQFGE